MSLWVKCDICGNDYMHPKVENRSKEHYERNSTWLHMDEFDICGYCLRNYFGDDFSRRNIYDRVEKLVREKGIGV